MARKQYVIHLNSGEKDSKVEHGVLKKGEIAVNYNSDSPMLMIEKSDSTEDKPSIATFIDEAAVDNKIKEHTNTLSAATTVSSTATNGVQISVTTQDGKVKAAAVEVTYGTFSSNTQDTKDGIAGVAAVQNYVAEQIKASEAAALGITAGTNVIITDKSESDKTKVISAKGVAVSETTNTAATDLALRSDVLTNKTNIASISADTKFTGAITGITSENSYVSVGGDGNNAKKISAQVSMLTGATAIGNLADAKDVKDYVDNQIGASKITSVTGDTNYIKAELASNKITVSAIAGSTSADNPTGLATAADAKVTMSTANTTNGSLRTYTFKQGTREIGKVEIDKEKFVQYGRVFTATATTEPAETDKEALGYSGLTKGTTYIGLQIGASNTDISAALAIPANSLVDTYTSSTSNYIKVENYGIGAKTGSGGLATYAHVTTLSGNVVTALNTKANTADYKVKSGAAGTNTTAAISDDGSLSFSAVGVSTAQTSNTAATDLALRTELSAVSSKVNGITVNNPKVTIKQNNTEKGSFTLNQAGDVTIDLTDNNTTYTTGTTSTAGLAKLFANTGTATDGAINQSAMTTLLKGKSDTGHTHDAYLKTGVTITNSETNKITAKVTSQALTLNFDNMIIDCGTY